MEPTHSAPALARARDLIQRFRQSPPSAERRAPVSPWWQASQASPSPGTPQPRTGTPRTLDATALTSGYFLQPTFDASLTSSPPHDLSLGEERLRQLSAADFTTVEVLARAHAVIESSKRLFDEPPGGQPQQPQRVGASSAVTSAHDSLPGQSAPSTRAVAPLLSVESITQQPAGQARSSGGVHLQPQQPLDYASSRSQYLPDPLQDVSRIDANSSLDGSGVTVQQLLVGGEREPGFMARDAGATSRVQDHGNAAQGFGDRYNTTWSAPARATLPATSAASAPAPVVSTSAPLYVSPEEILMEPPEATLERLRRRFAAQDAEAAAAASAGGGVAGLRAVPQPAPAYTSAPAVAAPSAHVTTISPAVPSLSASERAAQSKLDMATELADIDRVLDALKGGGASSGGGSGKDGETRNGGSRRGSKVDVGVGTSEEEGGSSSSAVAAPAPAATEHPPAVQPQPAPAPAARQPPPLLYFDATLGAYLPLDPASVPAQLLLNASGIVAARTPAPAPAPAAASATEPAPASTSQPQQPKSEDSCETTSPAATADASPSSAPAVPTTPPRAAPPRPPVPLPPDLVPAAAPADEPAPSSPPPIPSASPPRVQLPALQGPHAARAAPPPPAGALPPELRARPSGALVTQAEAELLASLEEEPAFLALLQQAKGAAPHRG